MMFEICVECKQEKELFEFAGCKACEDCWHEYWKDNNIGYSESWEDFKLNLKKLK